MKNRYWLKAGLFFALFEGIFWSKADVIFYWIFEGQRYNLQSIIFSFFGLFASIFMFGLFIKYTAKEVNYQNCNDFSLKEK